MVINEVKVFFIEGIGLEGFDVMKFGQEFTSDRAVVASCFGVEIHSVCYVIRLYDEVKTFFIFNDYFFIYEVFKVGEQQDTKR